MVELEKGIYEDLLALADRFAPRLRRAFLDAIAQLRDNLPEQPSGSAIWQRLQELLMPLVQRVVEALAIGAGARAIEQFPESVRVQLQFDLTNPFAVEAIDGVVTDAVREIANASQEAVQLVLREGFRDGLTPQEMARRLRGSLGLTQRYAQAVDTYRQGLLDQGVSVSRAGELADAYARRLLSLRATTIARTESIRAANAGQQAAWETAVNQKLLDPQARRFWVVTDDDRLCPICEAIPDLNPDGVALTQPFRSAVGELDYPPAHVMCRCAITIHTEAV